MLSCSSSVMRLRVAGCVTQELQPDSESAKCSTGAEGDTVIHMPTRENLQRAGQHDLIRYINDAGGFLEVPYGLKLLYTALLKT